MFDLTHRTALITGASGGIGGAIARTLHAAGATVILSGTRRDALETLAHEFTERASILVCDLSHAAGAQDLVEQATSITGAVDILINNAGLTRDALAIRMKDEDWQQVLDVNLTAPFHLARACLKGMMKRRLGRIINISSVVGTTGNAGQANYAASKAGLGGMTRSLAREAAPRGITVNCIAPGFITTAMTAVLSEAQQEGILASIPAGRMGDATEIATAVVYLASDEAGYITGQTLHINGGMAMG